MARKTVKTQFLQTLRQAFGIALEAEKTGRPTAEILAEIEKNRASERRNY